MRLTRQTPKYDTRAREAGRESVARYRGMVRGCPIVKRMLSCGAGDIWQGQTRSEGNVKCAAVRRQSVPKTRQNRLTRYVAANAPDNTEAGKTVKNTVPRSVFRECRAFSYCHKRAG